ACQAEGLLDEAEARLREALGVAAGHDAVIECQVCIAFAALERRRGDEDAAWTWLERATRLAQGETSDVAHASVHQSTAAILEESGQIHDAEAHYAAARELYERVGDLHGLATVLNGLGIAAAAQGRAAEALDLYKRALALHETIGDTSGMAILLNN